MIAVLVSLGGCKVTHKSIEKIDSKSKVDSVSTKVIDSKTDVSKSDFAASSTQKVEITDKGIDRDSTKEVTFFEPFTLKSGEIVTLPTKKEVTKVTTRKKDLYLQSNSEEKIWKSKYDSIATKYDSLKVAVKAERLLKAVSKEVDKTEPPNYWILIGVFLVAVYLLSRFKGKIW